MLGLRPEPNKTMVGTTEREEDDAADTSEQEPCMELIPFLSEDRVRAIQRE
jgi:hypothetical protein